MPMNPQYEEITFKNVGFIGWPNVGKSSIINSIQEISGDVHHNDENQVDGQDNDELNTQNDQIDNCNINKNGNETGKDLLIDNDTSNDKVINNNLFKFKNRNEDESEDEDESLYKKDEIFKLFDQMVETKQQSKKKATSNHKKVEVSAMPGKTKVVQTLFIPD